jgi:DNA-directed RNA polymerase
MTTRDIYWTRVEIATQFGQDKITFDERNQYVIDNIEEIKATTTNLACKTAIYNLENNIIGLIGLDATNQALQLYGILRADLATSSSACVGSGNIRTDAYQLFANKLNEALSTNEFNRDICKKPLMVTLYGSSKASSSLIENLIAQNCGDTLKIIYAMETDEWSNIVSDVLNELFPLAMATMAYIRDEIQVDNAISYHWKLPDGFQVDYVVKTKVNYEVDLFGIHLTGHVDTYGANAHNRGLAPNVIHSVDGYIVRQMVRAMNGKFITTIHDEFKCLVTDADMMIHNYKTILADILDSNLLDSILSQISGRVIHLPKTNNLTKEDIYASEFAIS